MEPKDAPSVCSLLKQFFKQFQIKQVLCTERVEQLFIDTSMTRQVDGFNKDDLRQDRVIYSYVVESSSGGEITDLLSFIYLPFDKTARLFYLVPGRLTLVDLFKVVLEKCDRLGV